MGFPSYFLPSGFLLYFLDLLMFLKNFGQTWNSERRENYWPPDKLTLGYTEVVLLIVTCPKVRLVFQLVKYGKWHGVLDCTVIESQNVSALSALPECRQSEKKRPGNKKKFVLETFNLLIFLY